MLALSIKQPWVWMILECSSDLKDVENRSWTTKKRGYVIIHASKSVDHEALSYLRGLGFTLPDVLPTGGFAGITRITDCIPARESRSKWAAHKGNCLKLKDSKPFPKLIPGKGFLYFFPVPEYVSVELGRLKFSLPKKGFAV
ncbi:MAG: hypothetical protein KIS92_02675 [Planctomycetota bacterium]|nr:hypothetical protein [Planctomycetota bacterium]